MSSLVHFGGQSRGQVRLKGLEGRSWGAWKLRCLRGYVGYGVWFGLGSLVVEVEGDRSGGLGVSRLPRVCVGERLIWAIACVAGSNYCKVLNVEAW